MPSVTKRYVTETAHRLLNYSGKCAHIHGHRYVWELTVIGPVLSNGIVVDFKLVKEAMVELLEPLDHALVLCIQDQLNVGGLTATNGEPQRLIIFSFNPTAENFAKHFAQQFQQWFEAAALDVVVTSLRVWETESSFAEWTRDEDTDRVPV